MQTSQTLLQDVLSADNTARVRAEQEFQKQLTSSPDALAELFLTNLSNENEGVAQMACVLLKKYFLDVEEPNLPAAAFDKMTETVLASVEFKNQKLLTLKRKAEILAKVYKLQNKSEELLQLIVNNSWGAASAEPLSKQFALYMFEKQAECHLAPEQVKKHADSFMTVFSSNMQGTELIEVRVAAIKATVAYISSAADNAEMLKKFQVLKDTIVGVVVDGLKADEDVGKVALEALVDLTQHVPMYFQDAATVSALTKVIGDIASNTEFEEATRTQACEVVLNLTENSPAIMRKVPQIKSDYWPALVKMLTECEQDNEVWEASIDDEAGTRSDPYSTGVSSITRLASQLKEKFTVEAASPLIADCLAQEAWQARQAGYIIMGLMAESCKDHFKTNMEAAVQQVCSGLPEDHTRVKYARLFALSNLLINLGPDMQFKYHSELVPALLGIIGSEKSLKLKSQAVNCLYYFVFGLIQEDDAEIEDTKKSSDIMLSYVDALFKSLAEQLTQSVDAGYEPLQEQVMSLLNVSASLIEEKFADYFNDFVPIMIQILSKVEQTTAQQRNLRARTIESMGIMIAAVAEQEQFKQTVQEVTEKLFSLLVAGGFEADDPQELAIKDTIAKIAFYLQADFHHVAPKFLEIVLKDASLDVQIDIKQVQEGAAAAQADPNKKSFGFKVFGMENKTELSCNVYEMEAKISAFGHILKVAQGMGTEFAPYTEQVLPVMYNNMGHVSRQLRKNAMKTLQACLEARGGEPALLHTIYMRFAMMISAANKKDNFKELKLLYKRLYQCLRTAADAEQKELFKSESDLTTFGNLMQKSLGVVSAIKQVKLDMIQEQHGAGQVDEEDIDQLQNELFKIAGAASFIGECADVIMSTYKEQALPIVEPNVLPYFKAILAGYKDVGDEESQAAAYFFIQYIMECKKATDPMMVYETCSLFCELAMHVAVDVTNVRQNAVYGIGVCAKFLDGAMFNTLSAKCLQAIDHILSDPEGKTETRLAVYENAIIALGFVSMLQTKDNTQVGKFLLALPMENDDEAKEAHEFLFDQILAENPAISAQIANVKSAVEKIVAARNEDNLSEEGAAKCEQVVAKLQGM